MSSMPTRKDSTHESTSIRLSRFLSWFMRSFLSSSGICKYSSIAIKYDLLIWYYILSKTYSNLCLLLTFNALSKAVATFNVSYGFAINASCIRPDCNVFFIKMNMNTPLISNYLHFTLFTMNNEAYLLRPRMGRVLILPDSHHPVMLRIPSQLSSCHLEEALPTQH